MSIDTSRPTAALPLSAVLPAGPHRQGPLAGAGQGREVTNPADTSAEVEFRTEFAWKVFNQNQDLIRATDQKTYTLIVMSTLLISAASANIERFVDTPAAREVILGVLVVTCVFFFINALSTLFARTTSFRPSEATSLIYFAHIAARKTSDHYCQDFSTAARETLLNDLLVQISAISLILEDKLNHYRRSWIAAALELAAFLVMVVFGRFM
jgi:hypothetical protein